MSSIKIGILALGVGVKGLPLSGEQIIVGRWPGLEVYEGYSYGGVAGLFSLWTPWFAIPLTGGGQDPAFQHLDLNERRAVVKFERCVIGTGYAELTFGLKNKVGDAFVDGPSFKVGLSDCEGLLIGPFETDVLFRTAISPVAQDHKEAWKKAGWA